jgi:hypothetical protein
MNDFFPTVLKELALGFCSSLKKSTLSTTTMILSSDKLQEKKAKERKLSGSQASALF